MQNIQNNVHIIQVFDENIITSVDDTRMLCIKSVILQGHSVTIWLQNHDSVQKFNELYPPYITANVNIAYCSALDSYIESLDDASMIYRGDPAYGNVGKLAPYTDLLRYDILKKHGGWWLDDDVILLDNLQSLISHNTRFKCATEYNWQSSFEHPVIPSNYCIFSTIDSPQITGIVDECKRVLREVPLADRSYIEFGPMLFRREFINMHIVPNDLLAPHAVYSPFNIDINGVTQNDVSVDNALPLYSSHGIHLTGLFDHIDTAEYPNSIVSILLNKLINTRSPVQFMDLYTSIKSCHPDAIEAYRTIHQRHIPISVDWVTCKEFSILNAYNPA